MPFDLQFWRALADYGVQFANVGALGVGDPPATWLTEYNRVRATAFASTLITSTGFESGSASGSRQFPQETLLDALHCRRHELDEDYDLPAHLADFEAAKARAGGSRRHVIRYSP